MQSTFRLTYDHVKGYHLFLGGIDITRAVSLVSVEASAFRGTEAPTVSLTLTVESVEITALGQRDITHLVDLDDNTIEILKALGWTAPEYDLRTYTTPRDDETGLREFVDLQSPDAND